VEENNHYLIEDTIQHAPGWISMRKIAKSPLHTTLCQHAQLKIEYQSFKCPKCTANNHGLYQISGDSELNSEHDIRGCEMLGEYSTLN
jgi:hypothetical protein